MNVKENVELKPMFDAFNKMVGGYLD